LTPGPAPHVVLQDDHCDHADTRQSVAEAKQWLAPISLVEHTGQVRQSVAPGSGWNPPDVQG
jgi:hypothetical protein